MRRLLLPIVVLLLAGIGLGYWYLQSGTDAPTTFKSEQITQGELVATFSATGTLEPEEVIDVGAQVAGQIKEFGKDDAGKSIDYGSPVEQGTILAHIDDAIFKAKVEQGKAAVRSAEQQHAQSKAKLAQARAGVEQMAANTQRADAELRQAKAKADQSDKDWSRAQSLRSGTALSQQDYDAAQSAFSANRAAVGVSEAALAYAKASELNARAMIAEAEAAVEVAEAMVATSKASLLQDQVNLGYCTIQSPVKGTIIDRRVTLGQTVQSSFNTPSLFLIARDLKRMTVWASVNEADIGHVRVGQPVKFTVDAYPNQTFEGKVALVRLNATNTQNVVVYTVEVDTDNPDGKLLPYMTANLQFEIDRRSNAMLVPNAALRYRPTSPALIRGDAKSTGSDKPGQGTVWVEENGKLKPIVLQLGLTDGSATEVVSGELKPEMKVVVSEVRAASGSSSEASNPFAPPRLGGGKKK